VTGGLPGRVNIRVSGRIMLGTFSGVRGAHVERRAGG
jgi:hypothetical protein